MIAVQKGIIAAVTVYVKCSTEASAPLVPSFGMIQIFVDLIFDLQWVIENKILSKITGYTVC